MKISPDETILWKYGFITINSTIITTWAIMVILTVSSIMVTKNLKSDMKVSRWQAALEIVVITIKQQMIEVGLHKPEKYIGFIGTLFLFIATTNFFAILPFYEPPTGSLSTTAALAISVFIAVPFYGILEIGFGRYLKSYVEPTFIMLPFNIISEISRTLALAVRLFGNIMSGGMIISILLSITPLIFPIIMSLLGLLTGMVQAYIFSILATVYITAATEENKNNE